MIKTTLQTRLISLLVLSSLFLISAFTIIQLNNQIQQTREFDIYRSRQEVLSLRYRLQDLFATYSGRESHSTIMAGVKDLFNSFLESGTVETISLLDKDGRPLVLEGNLKLFFEDDKGLLDNIRKTRDKHKWVVPSIDKAHRLNNLFVRFDNPFGYIIKLTFSLTGMQKALNAVYIPMIFTVLIIIFGNVILGALLAWVLLTPIKVLNRATKDIASGNLDLKIHINTKDELEELSDTFNYMTAELRKMKAKAENANPLTKLPGNIVIQEEVEKRISEGKKFVLIYCDLDNFKAFNDKYGVHAGDNAITLTADIIKEAISKEGRGEDFIGHEGGDDFLLLTTPKCAEKVTSYIVGQFDKRIKDLYSKEDLKRGYIEAKARDSERIERFPVMTISLAGVSNEKRKITSYSEITNITAEVKKIAKKTAGSKFILDRRSEDLGPKVRAKANSHK